MTNPQHIEGLTDEQIELLRSLPIRDANHSARNSPAAKALRQSGLAKATNEPRGGHHLILTAASHALLATLDRLIDTERERVLAEISPAAEFAIDLCESLASDDRISRVNVNYFTDADKAANRLRKALAVPSQEPEHE